MDSAEEFLRILQDGPSDPTCIFNPWRDSDARDHPPRRQAPRERAANLRAYVEARQRSARVMLMGEAPSHRGCRFTGIAFCSEVELLRKSAFVARRPLVLTSHERDTKPQRERSAAVIWDEIERAGCAFEVVLWNAFPWHPYVAPREEGGAAPARCGPSSNRKPRIGEVEQGRAALHALLECFTRKLSIFAVGKVAEDALARWEEVECAGYIRHPSQGGEARFREGFRTQVAARL
jgi:uracil-DNA glycosylase